MVVWIVRVVVLYIVVWRWVVVGKVFVVVLGISSGCGNISSIGWSCSGCGRCDWNSGDEDGGGDSWGS